MEFDRHRNIGKQTVVEGFGQLLYRTGHRGGSSRGGSQSYR